LNTFNKIIIVGGGHAGVEAASAAARMGSWVFLITQTKETIGQMSCNPAIGGIGKSHLAKEVDALGGLMAKATDLSGIHFKILNSTKGQAVRATRAQTDRELYKKAIQLFLKRTRRIEIIEETVSDLLIEKESVRGVILSGGQQLKGEKVILTTGTFLGGVMHTGRKKEPGGRRGDLPSNELARRLRSMPFRIGRLKTGTPPRLDGKTLNWKKLEIQQGDRPTPHMSYVFKGGSRPKQVNCHITRTTPQTHEIIRASLGESPLFSGAIEGVGPRYCPSIEDKVIRFLDKETHQIFVEPEGLKTTEIYPNGISTSLPIEVQENFIRTIPGFEKAKITKPGYAIEYDYFNPKDLKHSMETKHIKGLYFAGQINGTTGYEEAAAQGILAGINSALSLLGKEPWVPGRHQAYIGVLVDDLVRLGTKEPYRMFTSRAEHRLILREDNADMRLTPKGRDLGLVDDELWRAYNIKKTQSNNEINRLKNLKIKPNSPQANLIKLNTKEKITSVKSAHELLKRPPIKYKNIPGHKKNLPQNTIDQIESEIKYEGYVKRQLKEIKKLQKNENTPIPKSTNFKVIKGLSNEAKQKLEEARPANLARASRLSGITPAAVSLLLVHLKKTAKN